MKKVLKLIMVLLMLVNCSEKEIAKKVVDGNQLQQKDGIMYMTNESQPFTGTAVTKYKNGQINFKADYKDGKQDGPTIGYYESGQVNFEYNFKAGEFDGEIIDYYQSGQVKSRSKYKEGILQK